MTSNETKKSSKIIGIQFSLLSPHEGSKYGKIIDILIQAGCMNPIILFDELDKISDTPKGEEIAGVLTHLTDVTQNSHFADKYMSEISLDMSKALYKFNLV